MCAKKALEGMLKVLERGTLGMSAMLSNAYVKLLKALCCLSGDTAAHEPLQVLVLLALLVQAYKY